VKTIDLAINRTRIYINLLRPDKRADSSFVRKARMSFLIAISLLLLAACGGGEAGGGLRESSTPSIKVPSATSSVSVLPIRFAIPSLNRDRTVRIYLPPGYETSEKRYPVLYMHDGQNLFDQATSYAGEWGIDETLDELARAQQLELIVVGIDNGGVLRMTELNPFDDPQYGRGEGREYLDFVVNKVKPYIDGKYRTKPQREYTGIMGSSMGGLVSHYAMLIYPEIFSRFGLFSPSYWMTSKLFEMTSKDSVHKDARIAIYAGSAEEIIVSDSQRMANKIASIGHPTGNLFLTIAPNAAHNEVAWGVAFGPTVKWMFAEEVLTVPK
jgi:predicted alpha/beta superfamily hydrolase